MHAHTTFYLRQVRRDSACPDPNTVGVNHMAARPSHGVWRPVPGLPLWRHNLHGDISPQPSSGQTNH